MRGVLLAPTGRRWLGRFVLALLCVVVLASLPSSDDGPSGAFELSAELADVEAQRTELDATNARLRRDITALKFDTRAIERAARDQLGMVYPNELVLRRQVAEESR